MPFSTDTDWPQSLYRAFNAFRRTQTGFENRYYGPYTTLLTYCFGESLPGQYVVAPQNPTGDRDHQRATLGFIVFLVLDANPHPLLFVEVKNDELEGATVAENRYKADAQIRARYDKMFPLCPLPRLWGLSLFGTSLRVYCGTVETEEVEPGIEYPPSSTRSFSPDFLEGEWDLDILSPEGFEKIKEIVTDIEAGVAAL